ncbi:MAG: hypothetical protein KGR98_04200 [Verrucomicrobia bacterium]|nr:hypothetical protein [Verrucomicrobiota bacterium]
MLKPEKWNGYGKSDGQPSFGFATMRKTRIWLTIQVLQAETNPFRSAPQAAIQGLNEKPNERDAEIQALQQQNQMLERSLNDPRKMVRSIVQKAGQAQ